MTANADLYDYVVRHQVGLMRVSGSIRNRVHELLNDTEAELRREIETRMRMAAGRGVSPANIERLKRLMQAIKELRQRAFTDAYAVWREELTALMRAEGEFMRNSVQTVSPVVVELALPDNATLRALATHHPFEGKTLRQWANDVAAADVRRIEQQIKIGLMNGETPQQMVRRVVGSAARRGADGVLELTRRDASTITRTAVNSFSNQARQLVVQQNTDVIKKERYTATLDSRTTAVCRANDGKLFNPGEGPIPPLHMGCRSTRVPVIDDQIVGNRPMRQTTQRQMLRDYANERGIAPVTRRADLPRGERTRFDEFARRQLRAATGTTIAAETYQSFLSRQPRWFQEDVLGRTKARLFREGNLPLDRFVDRAGNELSVAELARREAAAFRRAGLDPSDFGGGG